MGKFHAPDTFNDFKHPDLFAGDVRVMENSVLSTWHTMFVRLHNLFADTLLTDSPHLETEFVFNEARLFTIAMLQHIIYTEELPGIYDLYFNSAAYICHPNALVIFVITFSIIYYNYDQITKRLFFLSEYCSIFGHNYVSYSWHSEKSKKDADYNGLRG